jgi:uncharacterized SAM-binding protein YcdF (DUF218 family)
VDIFFTASKVLWWLLVPGNLLLLSLGAGVTVLWTRWHRAGRFVVTGASLALLVIAMFPVGGWALNVLENRFPVPAHLPDHVDGIIVLGGAIQPRLAADRRQMALNGHAERMVVTADLARRFPRARVVYTGGSGDLLYPQFKEAHVAPSVFAALGIDPERVMYEDRSRNTYENAVMTRDMVDPRPGDVWLLVTSALHMPRSIGCFRGIGWSVVAVPTDFVTTVDQPWWPPSFGATSGLAGLELAVHEWLGLVAYHLSGRTSEVFPGPQG